MTTNGPQPLDYIGAMKLAVEAAADQNSGYELIARILNEAPDPDGKATEPTKILVQAIRDLGATVSTP